MRNAQEDLKDEIEFLEKKCAELESSGSKQAELLSTRMRLARLYNQLDNLSLIRI
ncbi:hypothetical protein [Burkholderia cenocepacia]|uniref:hypothetical protein n=1 Tax=Burkholderia cenocepacia TaxID=95486 RepID=UPI00264A829C|nr:hypothetical protein [Burkholderia cenocepacia]MDN7680523.1 hypothetical protein [Burkholderia cenocepacia]